MNLNGKLAYASSHRIAKESKLHHLGTKSLLSKVMKTLEHIDVEPYAHFGSSVPNQRELACNMGPVLFSIESLQLYKMHIYFFCNATGKFHYDSLCGSPKNRAGDMPEAGTVHHRENVAKAVKYFKRLIWPEAVNIHWRKKADAEDIDAE